MRHNLICIKFSVNKTESFPNRAVNIHAICPNNVNFIKNIMEEREGLAHEQKHNTELMEEHVKKPTFIPINARISKNLNNNHTVL